jgi:hypothetical protein
MLVAQGLTSTGKAGAKPKAIPKCYEDAIRNVPISSMWGIWDANMRCDDWAMRWRTTRFGQSMIISIYELPAWRNRERWEEYRFVLLHFE